MKKILLTLTICLFALAQIAAQPFYNDGLERSTPEAQGVSSESIAALFKALDEGNFQVHSLMLLRHGKVIAEHWWNPYSPELKHAMYSATKTFTATAVGFAVQEGLLKVDDLVISFFPEMLPQTVSERLGKLKVIHLLTMSAGHANTRYAGSGDEQVRSFLAADFAYEPGESFAYNITCSHMLSNIITRVTGLTIHEYLKPRLLDPLGIKDIDWEMDMDGRNMGNGGMHLHTSDMAKMGLFLLNKGKWEGKQLLNSEWIEQQTTPHIYQHPERSAEENSKDDGSQGYGYQTWMGRSGSYRAIGASNQVIMVIPEYDFIAVSTGAIGDENGFNSLIYNLLPTMSAKALKPAKNFDLKAAIAGYELDKPFETSNSNSPKNISCTRQYIMQQNNMGIEQVDFRFDAAGNCYLTIETAASIHNIPFGLGNWLIGATDRKMSFSRIVYPNPMNTTPATTAGICTWNSVNELSANYISMFNVGASETFRFVFEDNQLKMTIVAPQMPQRQGAPQTANASRDIVLRGMAL